MANPTEIKNIELLQKEVDEVFLMEDRGVVKTVCAVVIANKLKMDPIWLFLVAPSSGGKTEMINALEGLKFVHPVDTLTVNTFASGQIRAGKETSLLLRINDGILTFKDFTSILEMNKDARKEIMGQLRAIYDGTFVKRTGTGEDIKWKGRLGLIAAVTSIIHEKAQEFASMGERFVQYAIKQPDRKAVSRRIFANGRDIETKRKHIQECFTAYIIHVVNTMQDNDIIISDAVKEELLDIADFSTKARSGLVKDERNPTKIQFIPDPEMPTRVLGQLYTLAAAFIAMNKSDPQYLQGAKHEGGEEAQNLRDDDKEIIYKIALDSIPRKRRVVLQTLAKYTLGATTAAVAMAMQYHTEVIKETLFELNALGFVKRKRDGGTDHWELNPEYRNIIIQFEKISPIQEELKNEDEVEDYEEQQADVTDAWKNDDF